ncbi:MAG: PHP domain-containing protein [Aquificaceae bacterium]
MTFFLVLFSLIYFLIVEFYPVRRFKARPFNLFPQRLPDLYVYSFQTHLHSQFSYDSLGKPEDIIKSAQEEGIDYVMTTDHDNDHMKFFATKEILAGMERKVQDEKGKILGDLLVFGDLRIIAHPFKERYKWRLSVPKDHLFELIDLKDAILERKKLLFFMAFDLLIKAIFSIRFVLEDLKRLIDIEKYARLYMEKGIDNQVVGGLDHHVKVYVREVGIRFLFPHYRHSFKLMRNFLLSEDKVETKEDFLKSLKRGSIVISFEEKPTLCWKEEVLKILPPKVCLLVILSEEGREIFQGSYFEVETKPGVSLYLGYTYKLRIGSFYLGLKPLFLFRWKEVEDGRDALARGY